MSKQMDFRYEKYGDSILLREKDWRRVTKFLAQHGVVVTENFNPRTLKAMKKAAREVMQKK